MTQSTYDIIVFGASSFVGEILCQYLSKNREEPALRWAIAGRSAAKLEAVKAKLNKSDLDIIVADASDENALRSLCAKTRVVTTTVGPYALYGEPLVKICAETGTDYCDLTGEVQWIRKMVERYDGAAKASGARIVNCCGFDSIPSDLGVYYTQEQSKANFNETCSEVSMRVKAVKGGLSGGTFASLMNVMKEASNDAALRKEMADPYSLCVDESSKTRQVNTGLAQFDTLSGSWTTPFIMAAINTRIVQRSNSLLKESYSKPFLYDEAMMVGKGFSGRLRAGAVGGGLAGFMLTASIKPGRWVLSRVLPSPGEGPSPQEQENGFYDLLFYGKTASGKKIQCRVTGDRDPGYGSTAKMLGQASICLARDIDKEDVAGGLLTPASCFGNKLIERLKMYSGLTFSQIK
ncbi:Putative trans-acting enoyl reductase [Zhongshania aliphaticivorans]|uniref:Trans-acting enoyl reductase n=1 Tax=Zhongshania aliphaticivorans TaxID=1470434 RepID=A0A5S9PK34_9GAMM|nr:saccharopine dehydrogenase NADP-binding domain-containing protein [Zhongshania aliphaticivorans]CAA0104662.1 Putative trans-acting enoyl reductase [Zhongshania aliphaticivorans]CAA0104930.1 Putative trans-acting enoyl reductase [Zhongshania aliphaticivorans]